MNGQKFTYLVLMLALAAGAAGAATLQVSAPVQVTANDYYERGQAITYDGADYWLFYGRSASVTGSYATSDPDVYDYVLYYKKAASVAGLAAATPAAVEIGGTPVGDSYMGEMGAAVLDSKVWVFATIHDGLSNTDLYGYYTTDGGTTWTQVGPIVADMSGGQGHHDAIVFDGEIWVIEGSGNFTTTHSATPETPASFSSPLAVGSATGGLCHFFVDDSVPSDPQLYLALGSAGTYYIYVYDDVNTEWDLVDDKSIAGYYDPTLFQVGDEYAFYCAPYSGGRQWIVGYTGGTLDGSFFDGAEHAVIDGQYGDNVWVDMWPIGYTDAGGDTYLFYSSERNPDDPASEIDGNIWFVPVDWDVTGDHYTYIQEAVDAAGTGDQISIAAGTYVEQVHVTTENLTLLGEDRATTILRSPADLAGSFNTGTSDNYPVLWADGVDACAISGLTLDGDHQGDANYRFCGIAYWNAGGAIADVTVLNIMNSTFSGAQHGVGIYAYNSTGGPYTLALNDVLVDDFQKTAVALMGEGLTVDLDQVTTVGEGVTDVTAQNGIQIGYGAGGAIDDCTVSDVHWDGDDWVASGMLLYLGGSITVSNVWLDHCQVSVYCEDMSGAFDNIQVTNPSYDAFYASCWSPADGGSRRAVPVPLQEDYAGGGRAAVTVSLTNSTFTGFDGVDTWGVSAYGDDTIDFTMSGCEVSHWDYGVVCYDFGGLVYTGSVQDNYLHDNLSYGAYTNLAGPLEFENNYWDDLTGPSGEAGGMGDPVSLGLDYSPWLGALPGTSPMTWGVDANGTIQEAIDAADPGDEIYVAAGTYPERPVVAKSLTITGADEATVIVDAGAATSGSYGWSVSADDVTIQKLTLVGDVTLSTPRYGFKPSNVANFTLEDITAKEFYRTGVDLLGVNTGALTRVSSIDNDGHGLSLVDCNDITVTDLTVSGNAWQGVSVATWGNYSPLGTSGIVFQGTNTFADLFQLEMGDVNNPGVPPSGEAIITYSTDILDGADVTVQGSDFGVALHGTQDDSPDQVRVWFFDTLANAAQVPAYGGPVGHFTGEAMYIEDLVTDALLYVTPGCEIQAAIDGAEDGYAIDIAAGTYTESFNVDKRLALRGAGEGEDPAGNTVITNTAHVITVSTSGLSASEPVLFQDLRVEPVACYAFNLGNVGYLKFDNVVVDGNDPVDSSVSNVGIKIATTASVHHIDIVDCAFDHLGYGWYFAKDGDWGPGGSNVTDVTVTNTSFSHNQSKGIYVEKLTGATFTECRVQYNGQQSGPWNGPWNAGVDINLKGQETYEHYAFIDCVMTDNGLNSKEGVGLTVKGRGTGDDTGYASYPAYVDDVLVQGGFYTGNERGMRFGEPGKNNTTPANVVVTGAVIQDNVGVYTGGDGSAYGGFVNATSAVDDARGNWWGDPSGPGGIGSGSGDAIAEAFASTVLFDPWLGGNIVCVPDPQTISLADAGYADQVTVHYLGGASGPVYGYSIDVEWDGAVVTASSGSFQKPAAGPFASALLFQVVYHSGEDRVTIDAALGGANPGTTGPADLFTATFTAAGVMDYATSPVTITVSEFRDSYNQDLTGAYDDDGLVIVDLEGPAISAVAIENTTLAHTDDYIKNTDEAVVTATISDGDPEDLTTADITADLTGLGGAAAVNPDSYDSVSGLATWTIGAPGVTTSPADGTVTVTVAATDGSGNSTGGGDTIIADNTKPAPLTGLTALPGHNKVELAWTDASTNDAHYDGVILRYDRWNDYPQYDDPEPAYPATHTGGAGTAHEGTGTVATHSFSPADRDIFYYAGFVYDIARNYSDAPGAGENQDRSTNYWLGDINGDGSVGTIDISSLAGTYYIAEGETNFNANCDVGPTDDMSRLGIPLPDDMVDFDDLMIFAMNFGVVAPAMGPSGSGDLAGSGTPAGADSPYAQPEAASLATVGLSLAMPDQLSIGGEFQVRVHLEDASAAVQGARFVVAHDPRVVEFIGAAEGQLTGNVEHSFFKALARDEGLGQQLTDVSVAAIGAGETLGGSGQLAILCYRYVGEGPVTLALTEVHARNVLNQELLPETMDAEFEEDATDRIPTVAFLSASRPNPVTARAAITFGLPADGRARLAVYDATGRVVSILADGPYPAGEHVVEWNRRAADGSPVAGGIYFYRLEAGDRVVTRKMVVSH